MQVPFRYVLVDTITLGNSPEIEKPEKQNFRSHKMEWYK